MKLNEIYLFCGSMGFHSWGEIYNLCSGQPICIEVIVRQLLSYSATPLGIEVDPALVRTDDVKRSYGCWLKAQTAFGFEPKTPLSLALRQAWENPDGIG